MFFNDSMDNFMSNGSNDEIWNLFKGPFNNYVLKQKEGEGG